MSAIHKGAALLLVFIGCLNADASSLYVDIVKIGSTQYIVVEKNGITTKIPAENKDLEDQNSILKKVCSVLKCKDIK